MTSAQRGPWVALYAKTIYSETFNHLTCSERSVFLQSFLYASRMEYDCLYKGNYYHLLPGQFVISLRDLAEQCGKDCSLQIVRDTISKLVASGTWTHERAQSRTQLRTQSPSLITFINWGVYQHPLTSRTQLRTQSRTQREHSDGIQPMINGGENASLQGSYKVYTQTREKNSPQPESDPIDIQGVQDAWMSICVPAGLHAVRDWSAWNDRIRTAWHRIAISKDAAWSNLTPLDRFKDLFTHASKVGFLAGDNDRKWKADLEFVLRPLSVDRIMSGFYDNNKGGTHGNTQRRGYGSGITCDFYGKKITIASYDSRPESAPPIIKRKHPDVPPDIKGALDKLVDHDDEQY